MADIGEMLANTLPPEAIDELTADRWEVPQPLRAAMSPPEFPTSALPDFGRAFVEAVAEATQTPSAMAGSLFLAVAGAAVWPGRGRVHDARRPPQAALRHFAQIGALAAQQHFVLAIPFGVLVDVLLRHGPTFA